MLKLMKTKLICIAVCSMLYACSGNRKPVNLIPQSSNQKSIYNLGTITEEALSTRARLPGELKPFNEVNLFPKVNGFVKQLNVDRGSVVRKGQLLVMLEAPEMQEQYQAAESRYLQVQETALTSRDKYQRLKQAAREPGSVSPLDLDNAMNKMKADEAISSSERSNVAAVRTMQGYLQIYAPFDGVIVQRNVSPGALVAPGKETDQPMLVLQDIHKLRLEVNIPEDYVDKVDLSKPVTFTFNALPGTQQQARISRSANSLGDMRSEIIEIDVRNANGNLKPGMYAEVYIPMRSGGKSLLVPNSAVVRSTERKYVITVRDGKAHLVDVKQGLSGRDSTEVFGSINAGEHIIINPNDNIQEGDAVK